MTPPTTPRPSGGIIAQTATNLQALHPEIPPERLQSKVGSAFLGCCFGAVGLFAFGFSLRLLLIMLSHRETAPTTSSLVACGAIGAVGVALMILGAGIADFEVIRNPLKLLVATIQGVAGAIRGRGAPPDGQ